MCWSMVSGDSVQGQRSSPHPETLSVLVGELHQCAVSAFVLPLYFIFDLLMRQSLGQ